MAAPITKVISFGFSRKDVVPPTCQVFDARGVSNPGLHTKLKDKDGRHPDVRKAVLMQKKARLIVSQMVNYLLVSGDESVAVGCLFGRHRSVVIAEAVVRRLKNLGMRAQVIHRDIER